MIKFNSIKNNLYQIKALTEKNVKLNLRFKFKVIISFITPVITILMPLIVLGQFLSYSDRFKFKF